MTEARKLYAKISADLDEAMRERDAIRTRIDTCETSADSTRTELEEMARSLLPKAASIPSGRFPGYAQAIKFCEDDLAATSKDYEEAEANAKRLAQEYALANHDFGESAETLRRAMIRSSDYSGAASGLADSEAMIRGNELLLRQAEQKLARLTELARQNPIHRMLLSPAVDASPGHFAVSLWNAAGERLRATEWFRRTDADRRAAEEQVNEKLRIKAEAQETAAGHRRTMDRRKSELEMELKPRRDDLVEKKRIAETAKEESSGARRQLEAAERRLRSARDFNTPPTRAALADLVSILSRCTEDEAAFAATRDMFLSMREMPGNDRNMRRVEEISAELRRLGESSSGLRESLENADAVVQELDKVKRKMKRSGMSSSSRKVEDVDAFMASSGTHGFDMSTLVVLAAVAESVADSSPSSSSSDWSSSSSFDSSF